MNHKNRLLTASLLSESFRRRVPLFTLLSVIVIVLSSIPLTLNYVLQAPMVRARQFLDEISASERYVDPSVRAVVVQLIEPSFFAQSALSRYLQALKSILVDRQVIFENAPVISNYVSRLLLERENTEYGPSNLQFQIRQTILTVSIEYFLDKRAILTIYIYKLRFGDAKGLHNAAILYYGKTLEKLTTDEIMGLLIIARSPSHFDPRTNPDVFRRELETTKAKIAAFREK